MNELDLYRFCEDKEMDWRGDELVIWLSFDDLDEFIGMVGYDYISDGGMDANLREKSVALDLVPICEYFGIEPERIKEKEAGK